VKYPLGWKFDPFAMVLGCACFVLFVIAIVLLFPKTRTYRITHTDYGSGATKTWEVRRYWTDHGMVQFKTGDGLISLSGNYVIEELPRKDD